MTPSPQLSPRAAILVGLLVVAAGCPPILIGLGIMTRGVTLEAPPWVAVAAGFMFVCGGAAVIVGYAVAGGVGPDGDLSPDTPLGVRALQYFLGFCIVGLLFAITAWVAFGPGERHFSSSLASPFGATSSASSERTGRTVFGIGTVAIGIFWVVGTLVSVRRLRRARPPAATR
jgi:hypothetical protein